MQKDSTLTVVTAMHDMVGSWEFLFNWIGSVSCYDRPTASSKVGSKLSLLPYADPCQSGQIIGDIL